MNPIKTAVIALGAFFISSSAMAVEPILDPEEIAARCSEPDSTFILCPTAEDIEQEQVTQAESSNRSEEIRNLIQTASPSDTILLAQEYFQLNIGNIPEENRAWVWMAHAYGTVGEFELAIQWIDNVLFQPNRGESGNLNLWKDRIDHSYTLHLTQPALYRTPPCEMMRAYRGMLEDAREGDPSIPLTEEIAAIRVQYNQTCLVRSITTEDVMNSPFFLESDRNAAIRILNMNQVRREGVLTRDLVESDTDI